jgi:signal transduction histidine kinase
MKQPGPGVKETSRKPPERLVTALLEISNLVGSVMRLEDILNRIAAITAELMDVPICSIYLLNKAGNLVMRSNVGFEPELVDAAFFPPGVGIPGWVAQHGQMVALADATTDPRFAPIGSVRERDTRAYLCAPLRIQEEIIGVLTARSFRVYTFTAEDRAVFQTVSKMIAIVVEKARMYHEKIEAQNLAAIAVSLSGIAHYIKNVMFTTQIAQHTLDRGMQDLNPPEPVRRAWEMLKDSNRKIQKLVADLLGYSREEVRALETVDLNGMIRGLVESLRDQAEKRRVRLVTELDPNLQQARLDGNAIDDVLLNLLTNALDAIPDGRGGTVTVRTFRIPDQNNLRIDVIDDGRGIPPEERHKIFNLFFTTKGQGGSGIGLAASRKIVEQHGGTIEFSSEENMGTRFTVYLPLHPSELVDLGGAHFPS